MIYLSKNNATLVITDNVVDLLPSEFDVYLDEVLIGSFLNLSRKIQYLKFECPVLDLEEREYIMKIYFHGALIKEELVIVKDLEEFKPVSITKPKQIKMYEK